MIKVSVIIPIYNDEEYLRPCLESVVRQSLNDVEIICINDGSTDGTGLILEEYQKEWDNIIVYTQENQGVSYARNKGISLAKGEYVAFIDGDDYYPDYDVLECLYTIAKREHVDICGGSYVVDRGGSRERPSDSLQYFENEGRINFVEYAFPFGFTRFIYSKKLLCGENIQFPPIRVFEDPPFLMLAMLKAKEFYAINKIVYCYRMGIHEVKYRYEDAINGLNAMKEMILLTYKNRNKVLQVSCVKLLCKRFIKNILPYYSATDEKFINLLGEIQNYILEDAKPQLPDVEKYFTQQGIELYIREAEKEFKMFKDVIDNNHKVIIYGAGTVGKFVVKIMEDVCGKKPLGVAVTKLGKVPQYLENIEVTDIRKWSMQKEDALFIVAVTQEKQQDMVHTLGGMGISNIYTIDYLKLSYYVRRKEIAKSSK